MKKDIQKIFEKYQTKRVPNKFKLQELLPILEQKYSAYEVSKDMYGNMKYDDRYDDISICYTIDDFDVLDRIQSLEEKANVLALKELFEEDLNPELFDSHEDYLLAQEAQEPYENRIVIFLSLDEDNYITYFNLIGNSEVILNELLVFYGIENDEKDLDNLDFQSYLIALSELGYLD